MKFRWTIAGALLASSFSASAADVTHASFEDGIELIGIEGDIAAGDEEKFRRLAVQYEKAIVVLSSDGGLLLPSLEIGKAIHLREFSTYVPDDKVCASSCALIWVAGDSRFLGRTGKVGFHASYLEADGKQIETGVGNALVGRYLTQLELPERTIIFATSAPPTSIRWLRASDKGSSGIDFNVLEPENAKHETIPIARSETSSVSPLGGWRLAAFSSDRQSVQFVNTDQILRNGSVVQFWVDAWWSQNVNRVNRSLGMIEANCTNKAYRTLVTKYYSGDEYEEEDTTETDKVSYAVPGTIFYGVIDAVCDSKFLTGPVEDRAQAVARFRASR